MITWVDIYIFIESMATITNYKKQKSIPSSIFFQPTSVNGVLEIIANSKNSFTQYFYEISMSYIKLISKFIAIPLTHIFNKCILDGYFPNCLKISKIIVLYKSGKKYILGNYGPISFLPQISKILEKIIKSRLNAYINKNNVLNCNQFGSSQIDLLLVQFII